MKKLKWIVFGFFAIAIGLYPILYFLTDAKVGLLASKPDELLADPVWKAGFYTHITFGGLALLAGWTQFSSKLRAKRLKWHRNLGKIYVFSVLISALAGTYIGFHATGGIVSASGFMTLGVLWFTTTIIAYSSIRNRNVTRHEKWMILSYALCFAAVTLRIWLPLLQIYYGEFIPAYRIVAWLCWVPNLLVGLLIVRKMSANITPLGTRYPA